MKRYLIAVILLCTACVPTPQEAKIAQKNTLTPRYTATLPLVTPTIVAKPASSPVPPKRPTETSTEAPDELWLLLAVEMRGNAQRAIDTKLWENIEFKEEAYSTANQLIHISTGKSHKDSIEILKRFRWGMEFMDKGQLLEVIEILDQYN